MTEKQNMTILEFMMIKLLKGEKIDVDDRDEVETFETIKTIQKQPLIPDVIIETEEGSKLSMSIDQVYTWLIDKKKPRVKPTRRIKPKKRF